MYKRQYARKTPRKTADDLTRHRRHVQHAVVMLNRALEGTRFELLASDLQRRADLHDLDKQHAFTDVAYDAHDLVASHHVAYWIAHGGRISALDFLEHLADHMAVNADRDPTRGGPYIRASMLNSGFIFTRDDMSLYFNPNSPWFREALACAMESYDAIATLVLAQAGVQQLIKEAL